MGETLSWAGLWIGCGILFSVFAITGSQCQQNSDNRQTERFNNCVAAGGSWVAITDGKGTCVAKLGAS